MSNTKSKFPDLKEIASISGKLFNDLKVSVKEIIHDYKEKRKPHSAKKTHHEAPKKTTKASPKKPDSTMKTSVPVKKKPVKKKTTTTKTSD